MKEPCGAGSDLPENSEEGTPPLSVFIVEDEAIVADDLRETLKGLGHTVAGTAVTGEAAVSRILETKPGLVLMDIHLGGRMDGVEAAAEIRRNCTVPIIYLTAYADSKLLARAKLTQPYGYLIKPYNERELESVIEMAAYKYAMDCRLRESEERLRALNEELENRVAERTITLQQQVEFLQQLIDTIPAPVYYKDTAGRYLGCNNAFLAYTGLQKRDMIGRTDAGIFPSDMAVLSGEKDQQLLSRRGIQVYQTRFPHADHSLRDVIFKKATFNDAAGSIAGVIGVMIDISDRTHAEVALAESEARFNALAADMEELVFRCTPDRTCTYANPAFLQYFSRREEETVGHLFMPAFPQLDQVRLKKHLTTLVPDNPSGAIMLPVILPDGSTREFHWLVRAFFDSSGDVSEYQYVGSEHPRARPAD